MRTKVTLVLLFLNAALFLFIFRFERGGNTERAAFEVRSRVLGAEAADLRSISVASVQPGGSFTLERRGERWFLTQPLEWPANPAAVGRMINDLQFLNHETSFLVADLAKNGLSLADYGLDHPPLVITFSSGGSDTTGTAPITTTLRLGDVTKVGNRLYLLSPDGKRIHVVNAELAATFSLPLDKIRSDKLFTIPVFEADALNLQASGSAGVRVGIRRSGTRWSFETPILARADPEAVEQTINALDNLQVRSFVPPAAAPALPSADPSLSVTVEGDGRSETLLIGDRVARPSAQPGWTDYYAQMEERDTLRPAVLVVSVPDLATDGLRTGLLETLRNAQNDLRERHILDLDPTATITGITLSAPNQPALILQRLETAAGGPAQADDWQIVRPAGNGQSVQTLPAERAAAERLIERLEEFSAEAFQSDAPQAADLENWGFNRPERAITLTFAGGAPLVLQIGLPTQRDGNAYARLADEPSIYAVAPDILRETPVAPTAWRERQLRDLPAGAKITALRMTDLASGKEVWRWGQGEAPAGAIPAVLAQLRTLRARAFVSDSFASTVHAGGEDRPWKYRLDATLSLPGGASGERMSTSTLWISDRLGGSEQFAGSPEFNAVFALEQPLIDALWALDYGSRDPGPLPPASASAARAKTAAAKP